MYLTIGGSLIILLGVGCGVGAYALWNGAPKSWPDVVGSETAVQRTSRGLAAVSIMLLLSGVATVLQIRWACEAGAIATVAFVAGGFLGNYVVFGDLRPKHTVTNVLLGAAILWLLWQGYPQP